MRRGPVRTLAVPDRHHDVLRLDLALGLDAADVDVADAQYRVVAHGSSDGLGDLGIGVGRGLDEKSDLLGSRARLLGLARASPP
jgi:hypothetical protein